MMPGQERESLVLVIHSGGTIGMIPNKEGRLAPTSNDVLRKSIMEYCTMHDKCYTPQQSSAYTQVIESWDCRVTNRRKNDDSKTINKSSPFLFLPTVRDHNRVLYAIYEYDPLLDSSDMSQDNWVQLAEDIKRCYDMFDGFVILHGTDTLAFTASALSFMLRNLGKPVVVTGSQIPCFETRSDGRDNFVGALIFAANYNIPEVCVYFSHRLFRGNRTTKFTSSALDAFDSPNCEPLSEIGTDIKVSRSKIFRPAEIGRFKVMTSLNPNVALIRLYPSIPYSLIASQLASPIEGAILQVFGVGNLPSCRKDILTCIEEAASRGVIIVSLTQCARGGESESAIYETGSGGKNLGIVSGGDMTVEAALTKLSYVLGEKNWSTVEEKKRAMVTNIAGERTSKNVVDNLLRVIQCSKDEKSDDPITQVMAHALNLTRQSEIEDLQHIFWPVLIRKAMLRNDIESMSRFVRYGANLASIKYENNRNLLHLALKHNCIMEVVTFLIASGVSVHQRDSKDQTPLHIALKYGRLEPTQLLINAGANNSPHKRSLPTSKTFKLCRFARNGQVDQLRCHLTAGTCLDVCACEDCSFRNSDTVHHAPTTPLECAIRGNHVNVVNFLVREANVNFVKGEDRSISMIDLALFLENRSEIVEILTGKQ